MKFWKLEVNGNDFLLFYRNHKVVNKIMLCSERMGAGAHGWIEVYINQEMIQVSIYAEDGKDSAMFYDGIRCCAYWYMIYYEKESCTILYHQTPYRLKRFKNLITIEVEPQESICHEVVDIQDAMRFHFPQMTVSDLETYIQTYVTKCKEQVLHHIALGSDQLGKNLMRSSNGFVYVSAAVHMIYEGKIAT